MERKPRRRSRRCSGFVRSGVPEQNRLRRRNQRPPGAEAWYDHHPMPTTSGTQPLVARLVQHAKEEYGQKSLKFLLVSAFNVLTGQSLLFLFNGALGWGFQQANLAAVMIGTLPGYLLCRYWVWQKKGKNHFFKEVLPFWSLAFLGLVVSTILVGVAEDYSDSVFVLMGTSLFAFGCVWVAKFFILDKILFKDEELTDDPLDALVDEVLHHGDR